VQAEPCGGKVGSNFERTHFEGWPEPTAANDGESPIIVSLTDAAMHMYSNAIETLPDPADHEFPGKAGVILAGLRTPKKARNGIGLRADLIEAIEADDPH
jgi:hypothetical protein